MKKVALLLIALMVISVGFLSGCTDTSQDDDSSFNEYYFKMDVKIENYHSDLLLTIYFNMGPAQDNNYEKKSFYIPKDELRTYDVLLELNHDLYSVLAVYFYDYNMNSDIPDGKELYVFYNPNNKDMNCKIIIDKYGDISIDIT